MSKNDITGDNLVTKASSDAYRSGWDAIFGKDVREKELRDLGDRWLGLEYLLNTDDSLSGMEIEGIVNRQKEMEHKIANHVGWIDENDVYHEGK